MSATMATEPRSVEATAPALEVRDLCVDYRVRGVWREVLRGISFTVERAGSYGLVGESGLRQVDRRARRHPLPAAQRARERAARSESPARTCSH